MVRKVSPHRAFDEPRLALGIAPITKKYASTSPVTTGLESRCDRRAERSVGHFDYTIPIERVQALVGLAVQRGWDCGELLRRAQISALSRKGLSREGRFRVSPEQVSLLLTTLVRDTHDELLGLGVGPVPVGTLRMLGYAILGATDLRQALARFQQCRYAVAGIPPVHVSTDGPTTTLSIDLCAVAHPIDVLVDIALAATHRIMAWAIDSQIRLQRVEIPHPHQPDVDDYDVIFDSPISFSADRAALVFPTAALASPIMRNEKDWDDFLRHAPAAILLRRDYAVSLTDRARRILELGLTDAQSMAAGEIAERLQISPQTLRRKLREEDTSLRQIRERMLRDAAIASLTTGAETVAALSQRLGFSEPSAFIRAFRRWTGTSPGTYRRTCVR